MPSQMPQQMTTTTATQQPISAMDIDDMVDDFVFDPADVINPVVKLIENGSKICWTWLHFGHCWAEMKEDFCSGLHPKGANGHLQGSKHDSVVPIGYMVPNETGVACRRCMANALQCDKLQHPGGKDDPCSECRWFGGDSCDCELSDATSYNDEMWYKMTQRPEFNCALPDHSPRCALEQDDGPMSKLKGGYVALATREQLLHAPDFLPAGVRDCPRAYLVPPRESGSCVSEEEGMDDAPLVSGLLGAVQCAGGYVSEDEATDEATCQKTGALMKLFTPPKK